MARQPLTLVPEPPQLCEWFALCTNEATTTQTHPIIGNVPICLRCLEKYQSLSHDKPIKLTAL